eukprot:CAMPEP_0204554224 /NCGR_PEP_ID=MMETSP0661-20131031/27945_1 /ASSEMBLY_ACC=CAM_ASM_000606 /TAXON_ID=109239 /ORGANISM="Alexandrium margalefi, Strain AMGDE01CS-322" /LENGTH=262 /DNA_ID=CAMNT_0051561283 /DNA_START=35 /DNA_END=819 /DNA_ORIENTATION=+
MPAQHSPRAPVSLPTLLTSRPQLVAEEKRHQQAQAGPEAAAPWPALPEAYSMPVRVHNTFIDTCLELSPSLEGLRCERAVRTCPSASIGRFHGLFGEADAGRCGLEEVAEAETRSSSADLATPTGSEASPIGRALPPTCVISLAGLLGPPSQAPPAPTPAWSGRPFHGSGLAGRAVGHADEALLSGEGTFWHGAPRAVFVGAQEDLPDLLNSADRAQGPGALSQTTVMEVRAVPAPPACPAPGSAEMPSIGSAGHEEGQCKP